MRESYRPYDLATRLVSTILSAKNTLNINSLGAFVTDTAEIADTPRADTIFESMMLVKVVNSVSRKRRNPYFQVLFLNVPVNNS